MQLANNAIIWLRRDLQIDDNQSLARALRANHKIQPVFVFDIDILKRFTNKQDRRISFIANAIANLSAEFKNRGGSLLVLHGSPTAIIPAFKLPVFAGEDYEPTTIERDKIVAAKANLTLTKQHLILAPYEVLKPDGTPYKVFTPFSKAWLAALKPTDLLEQKINDADAYANIKAPSGIKVIDASSAENICKQIGYEYFADDIWQPQNGKKILADFAKNKIDNYVNQRDFPAVDGTSAISPYLRFGLITPRQAYNSGAKSFKWLAELIWREFYAMILYHFPNTVNEEFQPQYRGLKWSTNQADLQRWKEGKTGYPIVDAGMRQLLQTGWMHNRVRMIVASFLTKDLLIDWRLGEEHFAQLLMDYDQASNVGGWQWASSTGTDAAPYFRVFNPTLQGQRFDPQNIYTKKYVPEFNTANYVPPIVNHASVKPKVMALFKGAK